MASIGAPAAVLQRLLHRLRRSWLPRSMRLDLPHRASEVRPSWLGWHGSKRRSRTGLFGRVVVVAAARSAPPGAPLCRAVSWRPGRLHGRAHDYRYGARRALRANTAGNGHDFPRAGRGPAPAGFGNAAGTVSGPG